MGLTGLIYAAIVVAWAVFLVPMALRRHDQSARNHSIERFSSTMRVLSAGGRSAANRVVVTPARQSERLVRPSAADERASGSTRDAAVSRPALRAAARRRRRVLRVLVAVTLVTAAVSLTGVIPGWSFAIPLLTIGVFLVLARRQVRRADEAYWQRAANSRAESSNVLHRSAARVDASHGAVRPPWSDAAPDGDEPRDPADDEPTVILTAGQAAAAAGLVEQRVVAVALPTADGSSLWDPLPITLPTYVDKPVAKRSVRKVVIDGDAARQPGSAVSTGATALEADEGIRADPDKRHAARAEERNDDEVGAIVESPRAANA